MRYRALTASGDMTFGLGSKNFLVNSPATVAQAVLTRIKLWQGEWFLDTSAGTPWLQQILTEGGRLTADQAIQAIILGTQGVTELLNYASNIDANRKWTVTGTIDTIYGKTTFGVAI